MTVTQRDRGARAALALVLVLGLLSVIALTGCDVLSGGLQSDPGGASGSVTMEKAATTEPRAGGAISAEVPQADAGATSSSTGGTVSADDKLIIVNKTMRITVEKVDPTIAKIRSLAERDGGDITSMQVSSQSDEPIYRTEGDTAGSTSTPLQAYVTVRVPSKTYARFIKDAAKLGRVTYQSETSEDVTQQHVDLVARLRNLRAEEVRLRAFLVKSKNVREMLQVERELERVRGEIESMQAQVEYLERQAAMATVTLELAEPKPVVRPQGEDWGVAEAVTTGVRGLVNVVNLFIIIVISTSPIWVPGAAIAWFVIWLARRRKARRAEAEERSAADDED